MKRLMVIVFIIFGSFLTFSLYRTFAYDTSVVEEVPSTTDLEYTFKIGNSSIKQITVDSGETKYYDIVLGNPNNAKISYSVYYEMVNPSTKPDDYKIEYTSKSTGDSTGIVNNNGNITLNIVVTNTSSSAVTVKIGSVAGYVNGGELTLGSGQVVIPKKVTASEYVMSLDDGTTGDSGSGVYKVHHDAIPADSSATGNEIKQTTDYRYYGASPNNYVCLDNSTGTCEDRHLYRIIGSIYEENSGTNILKVIKSTYLTDGTTSRFSWDTDDEDSTLATPILYTKLLVADYALVPCSSIWSADNFGISNGSTLMKLLNNVWLQNSMAYYYNNAFYSITESGDLTKKISIDFETTGLSDNAKNCINRNSMYYLGLHTDSDVYVNDIYLKEHSNVTLDGGAKYWNGTVGLVYASDYGYAAGQKCVTEENIKSSTYSCNSNNWLSSTNTIWTISPSSKDEVWLIGWSSFTSGTNPYLKSMKASGNPYMSGDRLGVVHPVFYLDKDVVITSGTGTSSDPYLLSK